MSESVQQGEHKLPAGKIAFFSIQTRKSVQEGGREEPTGKEPHRGERVRVPITGNIHKDDVDLRWRTMSSISFAVFPLFSWRVLVMKPLVERRGRIASVRTQGLRLPVVVEEEPLNVELTHNQCC